MCVCIDWKRWSAKSDKCGKQKTGNNGRILYPFHPLLSIHLLLNMTITSINPMTCPITGLLRRTYRPSATSTSLSSVASRHEGNLWSVHSVTHRAEVMPPKKWHWNTRLLPLSWWGIWKPPVCQPWWPHAVESAGCCLGTWRSGPGRGLAANAAHGFTERMTGMCQHQYCTQKKRKKEKKRKKNHQSEPWRHCSF